MVEPNRLQVLVAEGELKAHVRNEDGLEFETLGCAKAYFLHLAQSRVGIEPELHRQTMYA